MAHVHGAFLNARNGWHATTVTDMVPGALTSRLHRLACLSGRLLAGLLLAAGTLGGAPHAVTVTAQRPAVTVASHSAARPPAAEVIQARLDGPPPTVESVPHREVPAEADQPTGVLPPGPRTPRAPPRR